MTEFSPFSCPIFLGHPEASGCCFQSKRLLYRREPNGVRAEPGKQKTRSCRTQELARSSARQNEWQKKDGLLNWKIGAVSAETCEQVKRNRKTSRVTIATGSTMVLDSSGFCDGERRMAVRNALGDCG